MEKQQLEQVEEIKKEKCSRKLDFGAPLLSTRRCSDQKSLSCTSNIPPQLSLDIFDRVPFSWEQSPGKPKAIGHVTNNIEIVPPPKLPPCMWHTRKELLATSITTKSYDGDIDNYEDDDDDDVRNIENHDVFSDALDVFSLGESIDMFETEEHRKSNTSTNMDVDVEDCYDWSNNKPAVPNFIIQRFLKDAKELAISSALENNRKKLLEDEQNGRLCNFSPKATSCGLDMFIPWRIKPKPCCLKNSAVAASPRMRLQWSNREKHASDTDSRF